MRYSTILMGSLAFFAQPAAATQPKTGFCVQNSSAEPALFAVDSGEYGRILQPLAPGAQLCTPEFESPVSGFVSVFLSEDALEGCSRLAAAGSTQILLEYHDFDRCLWQTTP